MLQNCVEQNYELDCFFQQIKQGIVDHFMPPLGSERRVTVLDLEVAPQSHYAKQCTLARWASPQLAYTVSTSSDPALHQAADRTKVLMRPYQAGQPVVDATQEYNRFDLINAIFSFDQLRGPNAGETLGDFLMTAGQVLLPGGHLLCSVRVVDTRICEVIVKIAALAGLVALRSFPAPLNGSFSVYDIGVPYKRLNLYPSNLCLNESNTQLAYMHYFIIFTRRQ